VAAAGLLVVASLTLLSLDRSGDGEPVTAQVEGSREESAGEDPGPARSGFEPPVPGEVTVAHHLGLELASMPAVVMSGRWVALPVRACYGGDRWQFRGGRGPAAQIVAGAWRDGDPAALWRLEEGVEPPGPELTRWQPEEPLTWTSIVSDRRLESIAVRVVERSERMVSIETETEPDEPGVYTQAEGVVGWTFGSWLPIGVLWTGPSGRDLRSDIRVDHFYSVTFANGREEQFVRALTLDRGGSALERLRTFAEGFRVPPELAPGQTPPMLQGDAVAERMRELAAGLMDKGFAREVADLLDMEVLLAAGDADLAVASLRAATDYYGEQAAVDLAEGLLGHPDIRIGAGTLRLREQARALSVGWIQDRMGRSDTLGAWRAYKRVRDLFPDDVEIRLLGVEIALEDGDWRAAQALLPEKRVPGELAERAARLAGRAARLQAEEGKIVIRFQPGRRRIPVRAMLNQTVEQEFVIDTGASLVTIPTGTARRLGLRIDASTPERWVSTAGGPVLAKEVTLASVELQQRRVNDVRAWVLDIPGQPETGLLGLNYLNRFHVEIDNGRGILMLTPR
jgi:clan AA aspartic protease (TIGR02281 family)